MERLTSLSETVRAELERLARLLSRIPKPGVETLVIVGANGQFLLVRVGWHGRERLFNTVVFARVKNGQVWVEEDNTEEGIAAALLRAGVPASDIVLAFHPPELRHLTDFAVASL
ncbi:MAG: XisI protein [Fimbriiglobus sp.]